MSRRVTPLALVLVLLVAACGDGAPDPGVGEDYQSFAGDGIAFEVPQDWVVLTPEDLDVDEILADGMEQLGLEGDAATGAIAQQFAAGVRVFAFDFEGSSVGFVDNLNVLQGPRPPFGAQELLDLNLTQMEQAGWEVRDVELRSYPAGDGFFMRFDFSVGMGPAQGALSATIITDDAQWVITFTASDPDRALTEFDHVVESFRTG